ncbi:MAG TPA: N(4)-(beta-N-acetylglucosaminyl)-L-asparaginase [Gemmataceae bacterium]|jgi:isoaspartyl peptidase/L-asparaginase-like protein (Ntn-hydrolase superfamily)|nr:N(4)-(beta-N-acetylglucosaminyl)-L-asparaginase [Gemmataceae bacterium]
MTEPVVIATWKFGRTAAEIAWEKLQLGQLALDAAIAGAQAVEDDPKVDSVGFGGIANSIGTVALDACVMDGQTLACGAVAGLENIRHAAALARRVMEKTPHVLLVGEGAKLFGLQQGFPLESLLTAESVAKWEKTKPRADKPATPAAPPGPTNHHDTVNVLALDKKGHLGGVCTTSGLPHKLPGRVGDSPLIGAGLYVDDAAGAAGATGVGEEIIRISASVFIVEMMRSGKSPQEACELAIQRINATAIRRGMHPVGVSFIALDPKGRTGAATTSAQNFEYAVARGGKVELLQGKAIPPEAPK